MRECNFPSLVASLFSWRCLAASSSSYLHAAINLRQPSVTASTQTSAITVIVSQSPVIKRPDVALYTVGPFFLLPTPSSTHCALKVSEHDSVWQLRAAHSEERSRPQKSSRAQRCLNALAPGYLKGTVVRRHPVVWSLALRSDDAKQDPVVYGTKFGVVFLAEGPYTASIQKGFDCFGLYHPGLERERDFRLAVELP